MKKRIVYLFLLLILLNVSCEEQVDLKKKEAQPEDAQLTDRDGAGNARAIVGQMSACGTSVNGSYGVISSYYTYPQQNLNVGCAANGSTISVSVTALDVPNRFTIRDASGNFVTSTGWLGNAAYPGPWGSSVSNSGSTTISFTKNSSAYYVQVETLTPPNYNYSPQTDYWSATSSCTCAPTGCTPTSCPSGYSCVNGVCQQNPSCTIPCGGAYNGSYGTIASYYTYPINTFDVTCAPAGSIITVYCTALDVPNRFTILDASNNYVTGSSWQGNAAYPGPWGSSVSNSGSTILTFTKSGNTYKLRVETLTPPNYNFSPQTDYWSATASCPQ
jgi:hypothetical protein